MLKGDCQSQGRAEVLTLAAKCVRLLTILVILLFILACAAYLLTRVTAGLPSRLQNASAAAYKAKSYFEQREALLRRVGDSVSATHPDGEAADEERRRQLPFDGDGGQSGLQPVLPIRVEHALQALQTRLLLVDAMGAHWLVGADGDVDLAQLPSLGVLQARSGSLLGVDPVYWLRVGDDRIALAQPIQAGPHPGQWLLLLIDAKAALGVIDNGHSGVYTLLDGSGVPVRSSQPPKLDSADWRALPDHWDDGFHTVWSNGLPRGMALAEEVGNDGWRLVYHLPPGQFFGELAVPLLICALLLLPTGVALRLLRRHVGQQLVQPALQQHQRLLEKLDFSSTVSTWHRSASACCAAVTARCCCPTSACVSGLARRVMAATGRHRGAAVPANGVRAWSSPRVMAGSCRYCMQSVTTKAMTCCCAHSTTFQCIARYRRRCRPRDGPPTMPTRRKARFWPP